MHMMLMRSSGLITAQLIISFNLIFGQFLSRLQMRAQVYGSEFTLQACYFPDFPFHFVTTCPPA